jgi:serine/threonine-protein kinase
MGAVYKGRHVKLKRPVAIKVLHDELVHEPTMRARFQREARVAAKLSHVNVIGVLDVGETQAGRQVMVMEFAVGPTLTEVMTIAPARRRVIQLVRQLLQGLAHAHGEGLIHRDLKPDNIIVEISQDGTEIPRIVDFGIAILREPDGEFGERLTASGMMLGTPLYMAPEQAQCDPIDHRADLFSLGVIVYEMLSGKLPFEGSGVEVAIANITRDPPAISYRAPNVMADPLLEAFARRLMARRPVDRFHSARAARDVLELIVTNRDAARELLLPAPARGSRTAPALPTVPMRSMPGIRGSIARMPALEKPLALAETLEAPAACRPAKPTQKRTSLSLVPWGALGIIAGALAGLIVAGVLT